MIITAVRKYPNPISRGLSVIDIAMILTTLANVPPIPYQQEKIVIFSTVQYFKSRQYQMHQIDFFLKNNNNLILTMPPMTAWVYLPGNILDKPNIPPCNMALPAAVIHSHIYKIALLSCSLNPNISLLCFELTIHNNNGDQCNCEKSHLP